jgi:hypothetical protein
MSVDEELLNQPDRQEQAANRAGDLREARQGGAEVGDETEGAGSDGEAQTWSEALQARVAKKKEEEKAGAGIMAAVTAPAQQGTSKLLQQAWLNLIDSWGLTLIWINIHVFLRFVVGEKFFCKLGHEWASLIPGASSNSLTSGLAEKAGNKVGLFEAMLLAGLDLIALLLIICVFSLIAMIVGFINNPLSAIWSVLKYVVGNLWSQYGFK